MSQIPTSLTPVFWVHSPAHFFCNQNNNLHFGYSDPRTPRKKVNVAEEQRSMLKIILKNRVEKGRPTSAYIQQHVQQSPQKATWSSSLSFLPPSLFFKICLSLPINIFFI